MKKTQKRLHFRKDEKPAGLKRALFKTYEGDPDIVVHTASVYDGVKAGMDTFGGRWQAVCELHGTLSSRPTYASALYFSQHCEEWCEECQSVQSETRNE